MEDSSFDKHYGIRAVSTHVQKYFLNCLVTASSSTYLNRIYILQGRSQSIPYPTVDLHSKEFGFITNSLLPRLKQFWQYLNDWLQ